MIPAHRRIPLALQWQIIVIFLLLASPLIIGLIKRIFS